MPGVVARPKKVKLKINLAFKDDTSDDNHDQNLGLPDGLLPLCEWRQNIANFSTGPRHQNVLKSLKP